MPAAKPEPGVSRQHRISEQGLQRLENQLTRGARMSDEVLAQWIRRYGAAAREIIRRHNRDQASFDGLYDDAQP